MRFTASLVLAAVAAGAAPGQAQTPIAAKEAGLDLLERPARLSLENVRLIDALNMLRDRAGVPVAFSPDFLPSERRVNCPCETLSVRAALGMLLRGTGLTFTEYGR